jgi:hypothetical protein
MFMSNSCGLGCLDGPKRKKAALSGAAFSKTLLI